VRLAACPPVGEIASGAVAPLEPTSAEPSDLQPSAPLVDVVGVGNAIVDVIAQATDSFVAGQGLVKGSMTLIDTERAHILYSLMGPGIEASGGSAANTVAGVSSFGGTASYIGKVAGDALGEVFGHDMRASGVRFDVPAAGACPATARCLILVTPDAQRTMSTYLGVSSLLEPDDVDAATVESGRLLFCEGYLWDVESAKAAIRKAMDLARASGRRSALTLSDTFCVERHHAEFRDLVANRVDVLFANQAELAALYETDDLDAGVAAVGADVELTCVTLGPRGSLIVTAGDVIEIAPVEPTQLVDTTGAGDQYAAGVLYGLARGFDLAECGRLGSVAAAEVISHVGPRPMRSLRELAGLRVD
jgi:sugar/nucleoside kinase (ribokinase family)